MLLVEFHDAENTLTLRLEGRLVGQFAEEVRNLVMRGEIRRKVIVDISEVTFVDPVGEAVLAWLKRIGAEFLAGTLYARHIGERLRLPVAIQRDAQSRAKKERRQASSHSLQEVAKLGEQAGPEIAEHGEQDARPRASSHSEAGAAEQRTHPHPARDTTGETF